jgi:hypothetical protein
MTFTALNDVLIGKQRRLIAALYSLSIVVMPFAAAADILDYDCAVGELKLSLHIDTQARRVRQTVQLGSVTMVGEYSDGVYGPIFHAGATLSTHQFVRVTEESIEYGAELHGVEETAVLNRRLATIVLPTGSGGWCSQSD